tara:strand:+ start:613 stop:816 length:204 start_codon:yes stop_codon:yes gene_type:complete
MIPQELSVVSIHCWDDDTDIYRTLTNKWRVEAVDSKNSKLSLKNCYNYSITIQSISSWKTTQFKNIS